MTRLFYALLALALFVGGAQAADKRGGSTDAGPGFASAASHGNSAALAPGVAGQNSQARVTTVAKQAPGTGTGEAIPPPPELGDARAASAAQGQACPIQTGSDASCAASCDDGAVCFAETCCTPCLRVFADYLLLRPNGEKVSYAVPINGAITPPPGVAPVQIGTEGVVDAHYDTGFRIGAAIAAGDCNQVGLTYTFFESDSGHDIAIDPQYVLRSLVQHPGATNVASNWLTGAATQDIDFDLIDLDFRRVLRCDEWFTLSGVAGFRYGHLEQDFKSFFTNTTTREFVGSDISFDGYGIRLGLEAERHTCSGLMFYGRGSASFLAGEFHSYYTQFDSFRELVVRTGWDEDRVVPILDLELGLGWTSSSGRLRASAGYMVSAWLNTIANREFIRAVQLNRSNDTDDIDQALTFDGFTARLEVRF